MDVVGKGEEGVWGGLGGVLKGRGEGLEVSGVSGQLPETLCVRSALVFLSHSRHAYFKEAVRCVGWGGGGGGGWGLATFSFQIKCPQEEMNRDRTRNSTS